MSRLSFPKLMSFALVAASPLAARFFMRSPSASRPPGEVVTSSHAERQSGLKDQKAPKTPDDTNRKVVKNQGASNAGSNSAFPDKFAARGYADGRDELNHNIEDFCKEYGIGQSSVGEDVSCPGTRKVTVLIAILPDPVHTHLALRFDRGVDDIEDAMQELGWTFDHSWLPWDNKTYPDTGRYEDREEDSAEQRGREENPGVLLFRGTDVGPPQSNLLVLVVGDTPTAGVNPKQFHRAMQAWKRLTENSDGKDKLAILGPTFAGSVLSLRYLLSEELGAAEPSGSSKADCGSYVPPHVDIASGTVTRADRMASLEAITDNCGHFVASSSASFGIDSDYQSFQLIHFLLKHNAGAKIISLSEAESSFGATPDRNSQRSEDLYGVIKASSCATDETECTKQKVQQEAMVLRDRVQRDERKLAEQEAEFKIPLLHFPREISSLRKAYEQNSIVGFGSAPDRPRTQLSLSEAEDTHDDDDTVATFSGQQSTLAMETEMSQIAAKLSNDHFSVVLLSATDMLDEIFVARYLQQHAPKVTVIIEDADLMFLRNGDDAGLDDVYVASPWPLIEENQQWSSSGEPSMPSLFQSQGDEGLRNATVYLVCGQQCVDNTGQTRCGSEQPSLYEYRPPLLPPGVGAPYSARPPLWLSVIGHGQFSPIALVDVDQIAGVEKTNPGLPEEGDLNLPALQFPAVGPLDGKTSQTAVTGLDVKTVIPAVKLMAALIALLLGWHGAACVLARLDRGFAWTYALAEAEHRRQRLCLQALVSTCAIPALGLLWIPALPGLTLQHQQFRWCIVILQILAALLATWPALRLFCGGIQFQSRSWVLLNTAAIFVGLATLIGVVDMYLWDLIAPREYTERLFFLYRNSQLLCGSSPALTLGLLLAAIVSWLHSHFGRLAFFGHRIPELPAGHEEVRCPSPRSLRLVTDLLTAGWRQVRTVAPGEMDAPANWKFRLSALSAMSVGLVLLIANTYGPQSMAHSRFDWWVRVLTYIVTVLIVRDVAIAVWGWRFLQSCCLMPLKRSHLRWGFSWIKGFSWRRIWTSYRTLSPDVIFDYMMRLKESNERIGGDKELQEKFAILYAHYYETSEGKNEAWANQIAQDILNVHRELARVASDKLWMLRPEWCSDRGAITGPDPERGLHYQYPIDNELKRNPRKAALDRMANEEFVALLYLGYIRMVLIQIRNRIVTASVTYVLLLWALTSYPWMNRHAILIALSLLLALISAATLYIYSEMHRDDILSRTTETTSGKLDLDFFGKVIPTIGIPLLTLVASQFPALSNFIFSWIEPGLKGP